MQKLRLTDLKHLPKGTHLEDNGTRTKTRPLVKSICRARPGVKHPGKTCHQSEKNHSSLFKAIQTGKRGIFTDTKKGIKLEKNSP